MKAFQTYEDFLIYLVKNPKSALIENCEIIEKFMSVKTCFDLEPHLFDAFLAQCDTPMNAAQKENFESFVGSYLLLKNEGFFESPSLTIEPIIVEKPTYQAYTSSMEEFTDHENKIDYNLYV